MGSVLISKVPTGFSVCFRPLLEGGGGGGGVRMENLENHLDRAQIAAIATADHRIGLFIC